MSIRTAGLAAVLASVVAASFGAAEAQAQTVARLENTVAVFDEVTTMGDRAIPADLLKKAQCVAIVPGLKKGAFVRRRQVSAGASCRAGPTPAGRRRRASGWRAAASGSRSAGPRSTSSSPS